jgi:hypothetical protein
MEVPPYFVGERLGGASVTKSGTSLDVSRVTNPKVASAYGDNMREDERRAKIKGKKTKLIVH